MNFEQIKSFMSVAKNGSFSSSAKERFLSQPTISNQIRQLEEELGCVLFTRNAQKVMLTERGKLFYKYASRLLSVEKDIYINMKKKECGEYGILDVAVPFLTLFELTDAFFVKMIQEKRKEGVIVRLLERDHEQIPELIINGEIEIGLTNTIVANNDLVYEEAFVEEIVLITPNEEKYRNLDKTELRKLLLEEGHIRYDFGSGSDFLWNDFFGKVIGEDLHNINTIARTSHYMQQLAAVEAGLGIGFISNICMQKRWKEGKILAYRCRELLEKPHYVVYSKRRAENSEIIAYTKELLKNELRGYVRNPKLTF